MNILQAVRDPKVFGSIFRDTESWKAWFAFLAALFGLAMTREQRRIYRECTDRNDRPSEPFTQAWLVVGRRGGKSFVLALVAVFLACFKDWRSYLGPGERGTVMIIAADRKQARVIMRFVKGLLYSVPMLKALIESDREETVALSNQIAIEIHTCSFRTVRGYTIVAALLDEVAIWRSDEDAANVDSEVILALKPAMLTVPGSIMLAASSPYARRGALWEAFDAHYGKEGHPLVWKAPTLFMHPTLPQEAIAEIERDLARDPARFNAEYNVEWRTDVETYVSREIVLACTDDGVFERGFLRRHRYTAFVDPSGGSSDSFTLAVAHREKDDAVLDCVREARPPFSPEAVVAEFAEVLKQYKIRRISGDHYAGEWPREAFRKHGIRYDPADDTKSQIYVELLAGLNSGKVRLLDHDRLSDQLLALERKPSSGGLEKIDHPRKQHDDVANAACGALLYAGRRSWDAGYSWATEDRAPHKFKTYEEIVRLEKAREKGVFLYRPGVGFVT